MSPTRRLSRMPAAMRKEAARLERGGVAAVACALALSGASFMKRRILAGWRAQRPERNRISQRRHGRHAVLPAPARLAFHSVRGARGEVDSERLFSRSG